MNSPSGTQPKFTTVDFNPFADGELLLTAPATESQKGSSGFEGISRTNGNRKPVWAMITA